MYSVEWAVLELAHHTGADAAERGDLDALGELRRCVVSRSDLTPPIANTLSTPWPPRRMTSISCVAVAQDARRCR